MSVRDLMENAHKDLSELAGQLRKALHNQNLADVVTAAADKCKQASEHPDADHDAEKVREAAESDKKIEYPDAAKLSGKPAEPEPQPSEVKPDEPNPVPVAPWEGANNGVGDQSQQGGG